MEELVSTLNVSLNKAVTTTVPVIKLGSPVIDLVARFNFPLVDAVYVQPQLIVTNTALAVRVVAVVNLDPRINEVLDPPVFNPLGKNHQQFFLREY